MTVSNLAGSPPALALSPTEIGLGLLKFLGLAVGTVSTLWGLTRKLTVDDAQGQKRLTGAGQIAIALAAGSFLVAGSAAGLELIATNLKKQNQIIEAEAARAAEADRQRAQADAQARTTRAIFEGQALTKLADARRQADSAAERLLTIENAAKAEERDAQLALKVSRGTAANLGRTQAALIELERVLQQLGPMTVRARLQLKVGRHMGRLAEFGRRARVDGNLLPATQGVMSWSGSGADLYEFSFDETSPLFPNRDSEPNLWAAVNGLRASLVFVAARKSPEALTALRSSDRQVTELADLGFPLARDRQALLSYDMNRDMLVVELVVAPGRQMDRTGEVVSIPDLERGVAIFSVEDVILLGASQVSRETVESIRAQAGLVSLEIRTAGRTYVLEGPELRRIERRQAFPAFVAAPVKRGGGT